MEHHEGRERHSVMNCMHMAADFGVEKSIAIQGDKPASIEAKLQQLIKDGERMPK